MTHEVAKRVRIMCASITNHVQVDNCIIISVRISKLLIQSIIVPDLCYYHNELTMLCLFYD